MSTPIEYMETDELILELKKRFDEMLFIGFVAKTKSEDNYSICVKSTMHGSFGLVEVLSNAIQAQAEE
jgi:hypothetical protein